MGQNQSPEFINGQKMIDFAKNRFLSTSSEFTSTLLSTYGLCMMAPSLLNLDDTNIPLSTTSNIDFIQNEPIDLSIKSLKSVK